MPLFLKAALFSVCGVVILNIYSGWHDLHMEKFSVLMKISLRELSTPLSLGPVLDQETFEFLVGWSEFWIGHCTPKVLLADQHPKKRKWPTEMAVSSHYLQSSNRNQYII
jgi:hypothetical protein